MDSIDEHEWRSQRDSRSLRYAGRVLNPNRWIALRADPVYAARYDGQVAILTAANLLGRMSPAIALDIPSVPMVGPLSWLGSTLLETILDSLFRIDPYGRFCRRPVKEGDYLVHLGKTGATSLVHGSGWNIYCGRGPSPLADDHTVNPIGPAMAAILAASEAFRTNLARPPRDTILNALDWQSNMLTPTSVPMLPHTLGELWTVGTGSVGTATLYFLSFTTQRFSVALFDMDTVKIPNLDRSPLFVDDDVGMKKVDVTKRYLDCAGITAVVDAHALDESEIWRNREQGVPDLMISTANERNVRTVIESGFPPVQVYGTTGDNWQAAVVRHIPLRDPCSICLFPETNQTPTLCATGTIPVGQNGNEEHVDAALPYLSFAAGAMAAAEVLKLYLPGYPFSENRVIMNTIPFPRAIPVSLRLRDDCLCRRRNANVHRKMLGSSYLAHLTLDL